MDLVSINSPGMNPPPKMFKSAFSSALTELLEVNAPNSRDRESEEPKRTDRILHDRAVNEMLIYCHRCYV